MVAKTGAGLLARHFCWVFFFNDTATTEIYTLSLHDALPISARRRRARGAERHTRDGDRVRPRRSEEHTSELQSQSNLVCRLLLEKRHSPPSRSSCGAARGGRGAAGRAAGNGVAPPPAPPVRA